MDVFDNFFRLNGYMAEIPILNGNISIFNTIYLDSQKNIYQAPIRSEYRILYFFFGTPQTVTLYMDDEDSHTLNVPANFVLSVSENLCHKFHFIPKDRPCSLIIYYQVTFGSASLDAVTEYIEDEAELIRSFQAAPYSIIPIHNRLMWELSIANEYLKTNTKGDALKIRNQICNILFSVFQQNRFESGKNYQENLKKAISRNTQFQILQYMIENVPLEQASDELHYTPRHIHRLVARCYGGGFSKVSLNYRVSYAMVLLSNTDLSLKDIGELTGFSNEKALVQAFKAVAEISPAKFRKQFSMKRPPSSLNGSNSSV